MNPIKILTAISCSFFLYFLLSAQEIQLPEEEVTAEDIRIEKTEIFIKSAPDFEITLPALEIPEKEHPPETIPVAPPELPPAVKEKPVKTFPEKRDSLYLQAGDYTSLLFSFLHNYKHRDIRRTLMLENFYTAGYRKHDEQQHAHITLKGKKDGAYNLELDFKSGFMELPGPLHNPFIDMKREFTSWRACIAYLPNPRFIPSLNVHVHKIDDIETALTTLNLRFPKKPLIFETEFNRQDIFSESTATDSYYQGIYWDITEALQVGGGIRHIDGYGERFLPSLTFSPNDNVSLNLQTTYRIPDLFGNITDANYKELKSPLIPPEEKYELALMLNRHTDISKTSFQISQAYMDKSYTWADTDNNHMLEPVPRQFWETALKLQLRLDVTENTHIFFNGMKSFKSKDIEFYPEELAEAGLTYRPFKPAALTLRASYTGDRTFSPDGQTGSDILFNAEIIFTAGDRAEWGAGIRNIADRQYIYAPGYPAAGREFFAFLRMHF